MDILINVLILIDIQKNGRKTMNGANNQNSPRRGCYVKVDVLFFNRIFNKTEEDKFIINTYPTVATEQIDSNYDTIGGQTYMILNNRIYRKTN